jgi:hypothetical protein
MSSYSLYSFNFHNYSNSKLPQEIKARYCFESEIVRIPNTEAFLEVPENTWIAIDALSNLMYFTFDQFSDIYLASDKKSQRYYEFILDSNKNDYNPNSFSTEDLLENIIEDIVEKPVQLSLKGRLALVWDLLLNKKIFISKY